VGIAEIKPHATKAIVNNFFMIYFS